MSYFNARLYLTNPLNFIELNLKNDLIKEKKNIGKNEVEIYAMDRFDVFLLKQMVESEKTVKDQFTLFKMDMTSNDIEEMVAKDIQKHKIVAFENNAYFYTENGYLRKKYLLKVKETGRYLCFVENITTEEKIEQKAS